jgi:hypothetical protein
MNTKMFKAANNNAFNYFLIRLSGFFILVIFLDFAAGSLLKYFYFKQQAGLEYQTTYAIDKATEDVIILGSSRAANIYNPDIFQKELNMSCFNSGRFDHPIFYHYAVLKANIKRHIPKIVILSFDAGNFSKKAKAYYWISSLLPYYKDHPEIRDIVLLKSPCEKIKMMSATYPYNSLILPILSGNSNFSKIKYANNKGYFPLYDTVQQALPKFDYTQEKELDTVIIKTFKALIETCIDSKIKLFIACPPYLINPVGTDQSLTAAKAIAKKYNIDFLDYSRDSFFINRPALFADYSHLNDGGVTMFSKMVAERIKDSQ